MKSIIDHYDVSSRYKPLLFTGNEYEIISLPYNYDHPSVFMRKIKTNEQFIEMVGGETSSGGGKNVFIFQDVYAEHDTYQRFFTLYTEKQLGFLLSSRFEFMTLKELSIEDISDIKYVPIPDSNIIESLLSSSEYDIMFVIQRPEIYWHYNKFRVHMFNKRGLVGEEIKVINVERYRDGGTTIIKTSKGEIYEPTPFEKNKKHTWTDNNGIEISLECVDLKLLDEQLVENIHLKTGTNWPIVKTKNC